MMARLGVVALAFAMALVLPARSESQTPFSSRVEAVRVDVLVTDRGQVLRGLRAADFEVLDNGAPQSVDLALFERLPVEVVLVLDMSDSVAGERLEHLRAASMSLLDQLGAEDQAALVTFSHIVTIDSTLTTDRARLHDAIRRAGGSGRTALLDAAHAGIMIGDSGAGRPLLIVFSDGVDTASWLTPEQVLDAAKRTDVVAYFVSAGGKRRTRFEAELTDGSGGALFEIESTRDLGATFLRILDEFRRRYVLSYTPRGVAPGGWHDLQVRVKGRRATVRARPGYHAGR